MSPLLKAVNHRLNHTDDLRADLALSFIMGTVFAVLTLSFILKF